MAKTDITAETVTINGVTYVKEGTEAAASQFEGLDYKIVRTYSAGVFAGYLESRDGKEVTLVNARRLWYWDGAASLSQLAVDGPSKPSNCKFAVTVSEVLVTEAIEILPVTEKAQKAIAEVKEWRA